MNELKFFWFFFFFVFLFHSLGAACACLPCSRYSFLFYFFADFLKQRIILFFVFFSCLFFCLSLFFRNDILGIYILILRGSHSLDRLSIIIQFIMKLLFIMKGLDEDFLLRIASLTRIYSSQSHTHVQSLFTHVVLYYFKDFFFFLNSTFLQHHCLCLPCISYSRWRGTRGRVSCTTTKEWNVV